MLKAYCFFVFYYVVLFDVQHLHSAKLLSERFGRIPSFTYCRYHTPPLRSMHPKLQSGHHISTRKNLQLCSNTLPKRSKELHSNTNLYVCVTQNSTVKQPRQYSNYKTPKNLFRLLSFSSSRETLRKGPLFTSNFGQFKVGTDTISQKNADDRPFGQIF